MGVRLKMKLEVFVSDFLTIANIKKGFTLVEIMIVLVILGLLIAVALPKVSQVLSTGKINATRTSLASLAKAIKNFNADTSVWPSSIVDLMNPVVTTGSGYHSRTLAVLNYSPVQVRGWKGPYMDGTTSEISVDAWGAKIALGVIGSGPDFVFNGKDSDGETVTFNARDCDIFKELGEVPGLYLHSCGDDTVTGTNAASAKDDIVVFVSGKLN